MHYWIDYWLNRVSMYRLTSIALTTLWTTTFVLSLLGVIDFSPIALIASICIFVSIAYISNRLLGALFGVSTHNESAYITAFILFFIFTPSATLSMLLTFGLIAIIASASKFLLVLRGRHIFNPAAVAAVIISFTGLGFASWWVATPSLLPLTLLFSLLILYKTRHFTIGLTFLLIATPLVCTTLLIYGTQIPQVLSLLMSWPLFFFVGFMLSEPQTLPPKEWQQLVEVGVVALLFAIPFHVGTFSIAPATALIVGNSIAFAFSRRQRISLTFAGRRKLTPTCDELIFTSAKKTVFEAGQYIEITLPHKSRDGRGLRRVFSVTSIPGESSLRIGVKFYTPSSTFKKALKKLPVGTHVQATGINGDFVLPKNPSQPLLFIAGGIGITPFVSHLLYLQKLHQSRDITLLYSVSNMDEIAYGGIIKEMGVNVYIITPLDRMIGTNSWTVIDGRHITKEMIQSTVLDIEARIAYVSGPPSMVDMVKHHLKELAVKNIKSDYFTGY